MELSKELIMAQDSLHITIHANNKHFNVALVFLLVSV